MQKRFPFLHSSIGKTRRTRDASLQIQRPCPSLNIARNVNVVQVTIRLITKGLPLNVTIKVSSVIVNCVANVTVVIVVIKAIVVIVVIVVIVIVVVIVVIVVIVIVVVIVVIVVIVLIVVVILLGVVIVN